MGCKNAADIRIDIVLMNKEFFTIESEVEAIATQTIEELAQRVSSGSIEVVGPAKIQETGALHALSGSDAQKECQSEKRGGIRSNAVLSYTNFCGSKNSHVDHRALPPGGCRRD